MMNRLTPLLCAEEGRVFAGEKKLLTGFSSTS